MSSRPGFRRRSSGGRAVFGGGDMEGLATGATPFSNAQILHLMKGEFARARRHGYPLACVLVQVDRLDALVAQYGEALRESVRAHLSRLVRDSTRDHDHVGMVGDDNFLLLLPHSDATAARVVADRLRARFDRVDFEVDGIAVPLGLSLGVAACQSKETLFFDTLLSQAEVALEWAIQEGGDRTMLFEKDRFVGH